MAAIEDAGALPVTRERAAEIARRHSERSSDGAPARIESVRSYKDLLLGITRVPNIYAFRAAWEDCWIAYVDLGKPAIRDSMIVVIREATGEIVYAGSARDEG